MMCIFSVSFFEFALKRACLSLKIYRCDYFRDEARAFEDRLVHVNVWMLSVCMTGVVFTLQYFTINQ